MAQTENVKQSSSESEQKLEPTMDEKIQAVLAPLQQSIQELREEQQSLVKAKVQDEKDEEKQRLEAAADIRNMLTEIDTEESEDKYNGLSNKQMIDVICDAFDTAMTARTSQMEERVAANMSPGNERIDKIQKVLMSVIAGLGLNEARGKFQDFDTFKTDIGAVMQKYPGMNYEDAYLLAKSQKAGSTPPPNQTNAEKPGDFATVPSGPGGASVPGADMLAASTMRGRTGESGQGSSPAAGIVNFRSIVDRAAEKVVSSKK